MKTKDNRGQVVLVMLLFMAVAMTVGVTLAEKTVTDSKISHREEVSTKTFNATEAGIEEALRGILAGQLTPTPFTLDNVSVSTQINRLNTGQDFAYPEAFEAGEYGLFWLREHNADGTLNEAAGYSNNIINVCWNGDVAVEIMFFYKDTSTAKYALARYSYDPNGVRRLENGFSAPSSSCSDLGMTHFAGLTGLTTNKTPLLLVIRPFYDSTELGVDGNADLPAQGYEVISSGSRESVSRKIKVNWTWRAPLPLFFEGVYSKDVIDITP